VAAPRIVVVIPALDEEEAIGAVIREIPPVVHEVIVVDNGSRDGTAGWLRREHPGVRLVESEENVGFCRGNLRLAGAAG